VTAPLTHRQRASRELDHDLAVTAGAGSGKTTVLVERFVEIARQRGLGPDRILAITFTRKAATEMKERIIRTFEHAGETSLRRATEAAYISTIHGFAERLLRERPFDARIDPAFTVLTRYEQELWIQDGIRAMYERRELRPFVRRLGRTYFREWRVFDLVREVARLMREGPAEACREADLIADGDRCVELALDRARAAAKRAESQMLECMVHLASMLDGATFRSRKAMYEQAQAYLAAVRACIAAKGLEGAPRHEWGGTNFTREIDAAEREAIKRQLGILKKLAERAAFSDWEREEALERELLPLKSEIYAAARAIDAKYLSHKRSIGALDFHDLQQRAAALLEGNEAVRAEYAERFRHILLDESQDTDELQHRIIASLRSPANTLFMVGDPKQAIYEFRGADPDVFHAAVARLPEDRRLRLDENFRSRHEVIAVLNGIGYALLQEQFATIRGEADYAGQPLASPVVTAIWAEQRYDPATRTTEPLSEARPREAAAVAEEVVRLLRDRPLVRDPDSRAVAWVPLQPRHVAILFRTRTVIPYFERALAERGVPYVTSAGQGFYERAEVLDCMMMLRAIAQPFDDLALAAVLRSPFAGASDADLWRLRAPAQSRHSERSEHAVLAQSRNRVEPPPLWQALRGYAPLAEFRERFRELRRRVRGANASVALEAAIAAFGYEAAMAAHLDGPAMLANLGKVRRQVRDMGSVSPLAAHAELERTRELLADESMAPLVSTSDDVVVLTTIHGAKGLEWPVVCLPNLQQPAKNDPPGFSARHGALLCDALDEEGTQTRTFSSRVIVEELAARVQQEERRLLYVALTRARERLILSASVKERSDGSRDRKWDGDGRFEPLAFLQKNTGRALIDPGEHPCGSYSTRVRYVGEDVAERTTFHSGRPLAATWTPPVGATPERDAPAIVAPPLSLKVTELLAFRRCPQVYRFSHVLEIEENLAQRAALRGGERRRGSSISPVELGTIVHSLLERVRFDASDREAEIERLVASQPEERRASLARMLRGVLDGEIGAAIRSARRVEREWPFATRIAGVLVEGVIDLAIQSADGRWTVADYKSNDYRRRGRLEYLIDYYTPQLDLYAAALARAGMGDVASCALVFLTGPTVHRWAFTAAAETRWSEEIDAKIAARDYATAPGPKCELCGYRKRKVCDVGAGWTPSSTPGSSRALPTISR
jgi:ATP-dependent helicase/nuclease subunit A